MSNTSRKVSIEFIAQNVESFAQKLSALNIQYEKLQRQNASLASQIDRSSLALENQAAAHELIAARSKAAGAGLDFLNNAQSVSAKSIAQVTALLKAQAQAQILVASASKQSAEPNVAPSSQRLLDSRIQLARAEGDYTKAQLLNTQAQQAAIGDETRLNTLRAQAIQIEEQRRRALAATTIATSRLTDAERAQYQARYQQVQKENAEIIARAAARQPALPAAVAGPSIIQGVDPVVLDSIVRGTRNTKELKSVLSELGLISNLSAAQLKQLGINAEEGGRKSASGSRNVLTEARGARDALFAFGLALNLIISELGDRLPAAAKTAASSIKIVADATLAGAYIGTALGSPVIGTAIGALAGVLLSLGAASLAIDPNIKALNDSLDKLGKKDDAAQGLTKLAGVSSQNAAAALEYLKGNQDLTDSFQKQVSAAQPVIPVLQGIGDAIRGTTDAYNAYNQAVEKIVPGVRGFHDAITALPRTLQDAVTYQAAYNDALLSGKTTIEASVIAYKALTTASDAQTQATKKLKEQTQALADIQNEINQTKARVDITKTQDTIDKLRLEGASADELDLAYLKLLKDKQDAFGMTPSFAGARAYAPSPLGIPQGENARQEAENNYSFLNATATKLGRDLVRIQQQYQDELQSLGENHAARMADIASNDYEQRTRLARNYAQRIAEIESNLAQELQDAKSDYATRLADLEENARDTREKRDRDFADRRVEIEQQYQDKIAQIQSDYQSSLFDIVARDDAKGLVRARLQREKALADAAKARDKENADAQKARDKQERDLAEALEKQKKKLEEAYEKRIRDLEEAARKQKASAGQAYQDQLADLNSATAKQFAAENDAYRKSKIALDKSNAEKRQALLDALIDISDTTRKYAQVIIDSLRSILDPAAIIELTNQLQKAFDTRIEIKVVPNFLDPNLNPPQPPPGGGKFAMGGVVPYTMQALVHAQETVLPADNAYRAYELATQHMSRISMPMGSRSVSNTSGGIVKVYIDNSVNSALLDSQIRVTSIGTAVEVIKRARGA